jgi:stage II sporulation protein D
VRPKISPAAKILAALVSLVLSLLVFKLVCSTARAQSVADPSVAEVRIGVLGLFHPHQFTVVAPAGSAVVLHVGEARIVLEKSSGLDSASVRVTGGDMVVSVAGHEMRASKLTVSGRKNEPVDFVLAVPEKMMRRYHGTLEIKPMSGTLTAIVAMDYETAVASVVAAENPPDTPFEALKAQAVAARSYFVGGRGRHHDFDFCDTTHCQFLREPPAPGSAAARAAAATRDLVLVYDAHPFAAMYTRSCSGRTRTPQEVGLSETAYPYYSVECTYCRAHPARWSSRISAQDAATLHSSDESARLKIDRRLGWSAVPSNDFVATTERDQIILQGTGEGHGIGLCQSGAKAMAVAGADFRHILNHYYPNTTVVTWPTPTSGQRGSAQTLRLH